MQAITPDKLFEIEGATIRSVHMPGHTDDHYCFPINDEVLIAGDLVLGSASGVFEKLKEYLDSLNACLELDAKWLCPGHSLKPEEAEYMVEARPKLESYIKE